jgi:nicotinate-nucleotide--dimethylbenzimidazole phosphoribosyltransferase
MSLRLPEVPPPDQDAAEAARRRLDRLTKPPGSLGALEDIAARLAAVQGRPLPAVERKLALVVAADHGVARQGVSAYPSEVTGQMVRNFLAGRAAVNVLAAQAGARVMVVDAGMLEPTDDRRVLDLRLGAGTADFSRGPAMSRGQAEEGLERGAALGRAGLDADAVACGEMGIGNTTAASAIAAALLRRPAIEVTGRGTGVDDAAFRHKVAVIDAALVALAPDPDDPVDVLAKVGGFEIAVLAGAMVGCAAARRAVVVDGLISAAAALVAARLAPAVRPYLFASHLSVEPGHALILGDLGLAPVLDLRMRLGEGTGAVMALTVLEAACRVLAGMATFEEAGVAGPVPREGAT